MARPVVLRSTTKARMVDVFSKDTEQSPIDRLPVEMLAYVISFLSIHEKCTVKRVCKTWKQASEMALLEQTSLCIEDQRSARTQPCSMSSHASGYILGNSLNHLALKYVGQRRLFFDKVKNLKVFHLRTMCPRVLIAKHILTTPIGQHLVCLEIATLEFAVNLPNLKHFKSDLVNITSLQSVLENSPKLTELRVDLRKRNSASVTSDYFDLLLKLPLGLRHVKVTGQRCDLLAIISSSAIPSLESLIFDEAQSIYSTSNVISADPRISPKMPLKLKVFSVAIDLSTDYILLSMIKRFMRTCVNIEEVGLLGTLAPEDCEDIFVGKKKLTKVQILGLVNDNLDNLIKSICQSNQTSLGYLELGFITITEDTLINLTEAKRLHTFKFLGRRVSFCML